MSKNNQYKNSKGINGGDDQFMKQSDQMLSIASSHKPQSVQKEKHKEAKKEANNESKKELKPENKREVRKPRSRKKQIKDDTASIPAVQVSETKSKSHKSSSRLVNRKSKSKTAPSIKVMFLGGLNEIGKNLTLFECQGDMFILDCGMTFPDGDMLGVDLVIPDFTYIEKNIDKIKGIVITHGHEDHIGAIPYLLKKVSLPIYGTPLSIGLIGSKFKEHGIRKNSDLHIIKPGDRVKLGCMEVEPIHVNHSIPDAVGVAIYSPAGTLVHTGDFKIDCTPTQGEMIDLARFAELGKEGVLALFADSTNAERQGYTMTEKKISASFDKLFNAAGSKRIIIATFSSNISRIQQIVNCAHKYGRKVCFSGRSMCNYVNISSELGYIDIPPEVLLDINLINSYPKEKVVLITTGSQGEPMSALSRMASSEHKKISVGPEDFIIISANPIPGNEKTVGDVINDLMKLGCHVVYESMYEVHVSGHACQEELKIMQGIVKPKYFIPVHGEQKHLVKHAELAKMMGMKASNVFIGDVGNAVEINRDYMKKLPDVPAGKILIDGLGVGDVGNIVLRDRKHLSEDGLIVVVATIESQTGNIVSGPDIVSRGFVYVRESEELIESARKAALQAIEKCTQENIYDWGTIKNSIKDDLSKLFYNKTRRDPMILPILMEV